MKLQQSYVHGASDVPLLGDTIGQHFDAACARWGASDALISGHQGIAWTWHDLKARVDDFASGLLALGLERRGRASASGLPTVPNGPITQFATAKAGLVLVNINPAYRLSELEYALNKVECAALVTAVRFKTSDYLGMLRELAPEIDSAAPGDFRRKPCRI